MLGLGVFACTAYGTYLYESYQRAVSASQSLSVPLDVSDRYDETAESFDRDVHRTEKYTGMLYLRKQLARKARGDELEVSAGTGRNLGYYDLARCRSLTLVDLNQKMLEKAGDKFQGRRSSSLPRRGPANASCQRCTPSSSLHGCWCKTPIKPSRYLGRPDTTASSKAWASARRQRRSHYCRIWAGWLTQSAAASSCWSTADHTTTGSTASSTLWHRHTPTDMAAGGTETSGRLSRIAGSRWSR